MPYGTPKTEEERKKTHLAKYGTLEGFPEERKGEGRFWKEELFLFKTPEEKKEKEKEAKKLLEDLVRTYNELYGKKLKLIEEVV